MPATYNDHCWGPNMAPSLEGQLAPWQNVDHVGPIHGERAMYTLRMGLTASASTTAHPNLPSQRALLPSRAKNSQHTACSHQLLPGHPLLQEPHPPTACPFLGGLLRTDRDARMKTILALRETTSTSPALKVHPRWTSPSAQSWAHTPLAHGRSPQQPRLQRPRPEARTRTLTGHRPCPTRPHYTLLLLLFSPSGIQLFATPLAAAWEAALSMGFPRQEHWSRLPFPSPGDLPDPGIKPASPAPPAMAGRFFTTKSPGKP